MALLAAQKDLGDVELDLSAVAKGFAVDRVAVLLMEAGIHRFLALVGFDKEPPALPFDDARQT